MMYIQDYEKRQIIATRRQEGSEAFDRMKEWDLMAEHAYGDGSVSLVLCFCQAQQRLRYL